MSDQTTEQTQVQAKDVFVNLRVNVEEVNVILAGLEELPHKISRRVVDNIIGQSQEQLKKPE